MQATASFALISRKRMWAGRSVSAFAVLFMLLDATMHALRPAPVVDAFAHLGYPISLAIPLAVTVVVIVAIYVSPRTSGLGAILITGYLGGATASHVRVGDPAFDTVFPGIIASLVWAGLILRDNELLEKIVNSRKG